MTERFLIDETCTHDFIDTENPTCNGYRYVEAIDLLNEIHESFTPIQKICTKYNINIEDLPDILEEYILIDNEVIEQKNIQNIIKEAYLTERTALGKSVLKQLIEQIGDTID